MKRNGLKSLGFIPIPALILVITVLKLAIPPFVFYDPAWLIPITNTLFVAVVCFAVAWIALRNYRSTGRIQILLLGCGVLIFGIGGALAGFVRGLPDGANLNVTIYNTGALVGALFHFAAALLLVAGTTPEAGSRRKETWLATGYLGVILFMAVLTAASFRGVIPPFFIQGKGPTLLRQAILGSADVLFAFSFLIFLATYIRNREAFLYWYSLALALTSISLTAFFIQHSVGSPVGWAGRCSQYLGGIYFLIALMTAIRSAEARKTTLDSIVTASLSPAEEKFRALAENSPDTIDRFDRELKHIYVNKAGLRLYGKPAHAIIGKCIDETGLPNEYRGLWRERIQQVFATGQYLEVEDYFPASDGPKFFQSQCVPEFGADGSVANVLVISRDLTERKAAEAQIEQLNQDLQRRIAEMEVILDTSPIGLAIAEDAQGLRIRGNRALEKLTGLPPGGELSLREANHTAYRAFHNGEQMPPDALPMQQACRGETVTGRVLDIERHDGTMVTLYSSAAPLLDEKGQPCGAVGAFMDITERKRAEEALQKVNAELEQRVAEQTAEIRCGYKAVQTERQRFLDVLETLPVIVTLLTPNHRVEWINRAYRDALGDNIGRLCYESQFGIDKPCVECQAFTPLSTGEPHNWEWTLPNGRTFDIYNFPFADTDGSPLILEMDIDITERRRAEEALTELNATLEQRVTERTAELHRSEEALKASLYEKEVLLKEIHHRVKNNMQVISSLVSLQADGSKDKTVREVLQDVTYRVRSMALVHEKLYQSHDLARIDFAEYARSLLNYLWRSYGAAASSIRLTFNLEPVPLPVDTAVPCGLILNEVAGNALKHAFHGRSEGEVTVSLHASTEKCVFLRIADNGTGFPESLDWRQAQSLGLRLVKMLSGQIGANMEVSSGEGTTFVLSFHLKD